MERYKQHEHETVVGRKGSWGVSENSAKNFREAMYLANVQSFLLLIPPHLARATHFNQVRESYVVGCPRAALLRIPLPQNTYGAIRRRKGCPGADAMVVVAALSLSSPTAPPYFTADALISSSHELLWHPVQKATVESEMFEERRVAHKRFFDISLFYRPAARCTGLVGKCRGA